jgi:tellurite resistance protein
VAEPKGLRMTDPASSPTPPGNAALANATARLEYLPVGLFGSVVGLTGLSIAWMEMQQRYGTPGWVWQMLAAIAVFVFVVVALGYAVKLMTAPSVALAEFHHPVAGNMFATFWISLVLLPIVVAPFDLLVAQILWVVGASGSMVFAWYVVNRWLNVRLQFEQVSPAWVLPVVGLLNLTLAVPVLWLPQAESRAFMLIGTALGLFFAVPLFTVIFVRLVIEPPLPPPLQPTLMLLVAPFAVGTSAYIATTGQVDLFAKALYVLTLFVLSVVIGTLGRLPIRRPFKIAWWVVSFPLAACAIAALRLAQAEPGLATDGIAIALVALSSVVILWLLVRTVFGALRGELKSMST